MNVNGRWTVVMTTLDAPTQMEASPVHVMMVTTETASSASVSFCSSDNNGLLLVLNSFIKEIHTPYIFLL